MLNKLKLIMFFLVLTCSSQQQQQEAQKEPLQDGQAQFQFEENGQELVNQNSDSNANANQAGFNQEQFSNENMGNIDNAIPELNANSSNISEGVNIVQNQPMNDTMANPINNMPLEENISAAPSYPVHEANPMTNPAPAPVTAEPAQADAFAPTQVQVIERQYQPPALADELNHRIFRNRETASILPPIRATLWWVGFDYQKKDGYVRVEIVTRGDPKFAVLQEVNQSGQPELLLRFYETDLRPKIRRSINASEFRSPVSFIRMREAELDGYVDVLITLRDAVRPRLYAKQGNVLLTFEIPERYYGNLSMGQGPIEQAQVLPIADIRPMIAKGSDMPEAIDLAQKFHYPDHSGNAFLTAPANGGQELTEIPPNMENPIATAPADLYPQQMQQQNSLPVARIPETLATPAAVLRETSQVPDQYQNGWGQAALPPVIPSNGQNQNGLAQAPAVQLPASSTFAPDPIPYGAPDPSPSAQTPAAEFPEVGTESGGYVNYAPQNANSGTEEVELKIDDLDNGGNFFENDGLDDFDDGYGDFKDPASKFEVHKPSPSKTHQWVTLVTSQIMTVGQDNGAEDFDDFSNVEDYSLENPASGQSNYANSMNKVQGSENLYSNPSNPATVPATNAPAANLANPAATTYANPGAFVNAQGVNTQGVANPSNNGAFSAPGSTNLPSNYAPVNQASMGAQEVYPSNSSNQQEPAYTYRPENPTERLISVSFKEMPLDYVMKIIMEESKINYIMHPSIQKTPVTIEIHDEPWSLALKAVLETHSLGFVELSPTLVRIDTLDNLNKEKEMLESIRQKAINLTPPKTLVHRLSYAKADDALKQGTNLLNEGKHGPFKISADARTNSIILNAIPTTIAMMQEIFKRIDLPTPQVDIATRVIEVTDDFRRGFGIGWRSPFHYDTGRGMRAGALTFPNSATGDFAIDATVSENIIGQLPIKFGSMNNAFELDMALQFGQSNRTVEILQNTNVVVQDNQEAEINTGKIDTYVTFTAEGNGTMQVEYTLSLKVTPQITSNGMVNMKLEVESSDPAPPQPGADASRMTKMIKTMSMRRSGETAVIGGLYTKNKTNIKAGVPFLSDIPIIGALFRSNQDEDTKREIMIMITPTVQVNGSSYDQQVPEPVGVSSSPDYASNSSGNILNMAANNTANTGTTQAASVNAPNANAASFQNQNMGQVQQDMQEEEEFPEQEFNNVQFQENPDQSANLMQQGNVNPLQQGNVNLQQQASPQNAGQQGNTINFQNQQQFSNQGNVQEESSQEFEEEFDE